MKKRGIAFLLSLLIASSFSMSTAFAAESNNDKIYQGVTSYVNEVYVNLNSKDKNELIEKLYKEKTSSKKLSTFNLSESKISVDKKQKDKKELDADFEKVNKEENYIVNLINSQGNDTNTSNWEFNLKYLKENYNTIKKMKDVNMKDVDSYIEAYTYVLKAKDMPDEKVSKKTSISGNSFLEASLRSSGSYNRGYALDYASRYAYHFNTSYPDWSNNGGDCANFVSQCLYAGGKQMKGSDASDFSNWFSHGSSRSTTNVSSTWRGADAFKWYWMDNADSYKKFTSVGEGSFNYAYRGDALSFINSNGRAVHTMLVTDYDYSNSDDILSGHSYSTDEASLNYKFNNGSYSSFIIYNMG